MESEALISSIGDEKAHQLGFRYWAYSAWTGAPRERLWSTHNVPPDVWSAYLDALHAAVHLRPMLWDLNLLPTPAPSAPSAPSADSADSAATAATADDPLLVLLRRHDITCGLQLPLYDSGELVATLVLASGGRLGNRACQAVFQQGLSMLCELHQLCVPHLCRPHMPPNRRAGDRAAASFA